MHPKWTHASQIIYNSLSTGILYYLSDVPSGQGIPSRWKDRPTWGVFALTQKDSEWSEAPRTLGVLNRWLEFVPGF